ncbi:hypothetical protein SB717_37245, partial [Priestia sp. SIMBA_032]|uniref:hypothetical protein n=1 Tax=Priestia sp. SIMBA_032 TaxID=3085775 RepID=UPI00397B5C10
HMQDLTPFEEDVFATVSLATVLPFSTTEAIAALSEDEREAAVEEWIDSGHAEEHVAELDWHIDDARFTKARRVTDFELGIPSLDGV